MRKIKHIDYKFGEDTIFTDFCRAENGWIIAGDVKIEGKYKIMLLKIDENGEEMWNKIHGEEEEHEAQSIIKDRGYLIGGNAYGKATKGGGESWKAYILSVDEHGKKMGEISYAIGKNDAIYSMIRMGDELWVMGESDGRGIFIMRLDKELKLREVKRYQGYEEVLAGSITPRFLCYSYKNSNRWYGRVARINEELKEEWEMEIPNLLIYSTKEFDGSLLVAGTEEDTGVAMKIDEKEEKEVVFKDGSILSVEIHEDKVILSGESEGKPVIYLLNKDLKMIDEFVDDFPGWYERAFFANSDRIITLGYSPGERKGIISMLETT